MAKLLRKSKTESVLNKSDFSIAGRNFRSPFYPILTAVTWMLLMVGSASAALRTWTGAGGNDNWSTAANWGGIVPGIGDDIAFGGSTRLTPNNDLAANTSFNSIAFNGGAGNFVIGGNSINVAGGASSIVSSVSSGSETISLAITFTGSATISSAAGGQLILSGSVSNGNFAMTVSSSGNTDITGVLSGTGSLTKSGGGI